MTVRFHLNPDGQPHIYDHGVVEAEVRDALDRPLFQMAGRDESTLFFGVTRAGRMLKIIFVDARGGDGIFVITAFELPAKQRRALLRRLKRKKK